MKINNTIIIKSKITEKGYTQRKIAKELDISEVTLSKWINGKLGNIDKFIKLCIMLDIDVNELIKK